MEQLKGYGRNSPVNTIQTELINEIIALVLNNSDPRASEFIIKYGANAKAAGFLFAEFRNLYRDLLKLEKTIAPKQKPFDNNYKVNEELVLSLRNANFEVLFKEPHGPIHAEVQILSHLIEMINNHTLTTIDQKKIYIGISKLCCLNCRVMLEKANDIFTEDKIKILLETRGRHDLDFGDKWIPPNLFSKGYNSPKSSVQNKSLEFRIGYYCKESINDLKQQTAPTGVSMMPSQSSSDDETTLMRSIEDRKITLKEQLALLHEMQALNKEATVEIIMLLIDTAIKLHEIKRYLYFVDKIGKTVEVKEDIFFAIFGELHRENNNLKPEDLLKVFKMSPLVGEKVALFFQDFNLDALAKRNDTLTESAALPLAHQNITITLHKDFLDKRQAESPQFQVATSLNQTEAKSPDSKKIKNDDN